MSARVAPEARGLQDRIEASSLGRALISAFLAVTVGALVLWNLPESELRTRTLPMVEPYILATGLGQNWGVFAPDPRRQTIELVGRVTFSDGRTEAVLLPRGGPFVSPYWDYRWLKWDELAVSSDHEDLLHPTAMWFAREAEEDGDKPTRVVLVKRTYALFPPGPGPARGEWEETNLYTLTVTQPGGDG